MGLNVMKPAVHILKALIFSIKTALVFLIKTCYRLVRYHPSVLCALLPFFLLYKFFPSVFSYLLSSFPIFICTIVLIATLVAFGRRQDTSQVEQKQKSSEKTKHITDDSVIEKDLKINEEPYGNKADIKDKAIEGASSTQVSKRKSTKRVTFSPINYDGPIVKTVTDQQQPKEIHEDGKPAIDKPIGEIPDTHSEGPSDSSNDLSLKQNEDTAESSGSGSNYAESSAPRAPMVDINPVTDEPQQVSDPQPSQPVLLSIDEFDGAPEESDRSNDESLESEDTEKNGTKSVVTWTEDDEKNLMDLGSSELERNQRLESLMARRRARKKMLRMVADKNLLDMDGNDPPAQMAPLSIIKTNPFDIPISNEIAGLPPLPGSAPSVLVPRTNPFDLPYDPQEEKPDLTGDSFHQEFMTVLQKDIYCRHESFCFGSTSYSGGLKDKCDNNIRSYSIIEDLVSTEPRPLSERSDSTASFVPETELRSSVSGQEDQKKPIEEQITQEGESTSQIDYSPQFIDGTTQPSEADLVEIQQGSTRDVEISLPDVVEEKYSDSSSPTSSSSSEFDSTEVQSQNVEPTRGDHTKDLKSGMTVKVVKDNNQAHEPVYDSSPSAIEKRTIEESLFCVDKGVVLSSVSSIASDLQVEVSEVSSLSASSERIAAFTDEESLRYEGDLRSEDPWAASSNLSAVDENESKSKEVTEISESDVINVGLLGAHNDSVDAINEAHLEIQPRVDSNSTPLTNEPIKDGLMNQNPSSSAESEMHEQVHQLEGEDNVESTASSSSPGQLPVEQSMAQPSMGSSHHEEKQERSSTEEGQIINNEKDLVAIDSNLISSPLMNEPIKEGLINQTPSSSAEPEMHNRVKQLNSEENVDPITSSSFPVQPVVEKSVVQPPIYGDHHEEAQEPSIKSTVEGNVVNNVKHPVEVDSNSTSSLLASEPIKEGLNNQIQSSDEMHNQVCQLNLKDNMDPIASSSSHVRLLIEKSMVRPSMDGDPYDEAQSIKSTEEHNSYNNVDDLVEANSNSTSSIMNEPIKEGLINQIPGSAAEPEMHNSIHQLNLENVDPIASSSSPVQVLTEKFTVPASMDGDHHEEAQEPSINLTKEGNIVNDVKDPGAVNSNSTSSLLNEPTKEGLMHQNPSSGVESEMHNQVHQLNLEENLNLVASSSTSSVTTEPVKEGVMNQNPSPSAEPEMHNQVHRLNSKENVDLVASNSTSPLMDEADEPMKDDLMNQNPSSGVEPEMQHRVHQLNLEENLNLVASNSTSSVMTEPVEGLMNRYSPSSAEYEMHNRVHEFNSEENVDPLASKSNSSLMDESTKDGFMNQNPSSGVEPDIHNGVHELNSEENVDPVASNSTSSVMKEQVKESLMNQNPPSSAEQEMHNQVHQFNPEENVDPVASKSTSSLMDEPIKDGLMNQNPSSGVEPEIHNFVHELNSEENVDPVTSNSTLSPMDEPIKNDLMNQNPSTGVEPEMHNQVLELNVEADVKPVASNSTLMSEQVKESLVNQITPSSIEPEMHNQVHQLNLEEYVNPIASGYTPVHLLVEKSVVQPSMDGDNHEETQELSIKSADEGPVFDNVKDSKPAVDEEKSKSIEDIEEDSKKPIEHQVIVTTLPDTISESKDGSFTDQHGSYKLSEMGESEVHKPALESNHHLENEISSKALHNEQEVQPIIPQTIIESGTVNSTDHHHPDHGISSERQETTEEGIQKQFLEDANRLENETSKHQHTEKAMAHQLTPDETSLESGVNSSADHADDHGSYKLPETIESKMQDTEACSSNNHLESGSSTSEHLHNEKEVHQQVTPETILESSVGVSSADHGNNDLDSTTERRAEKQSAFEANHDVDKETSKHLLHNKQEVHQQVTPETTSESSGVMNSVDHGTTNIQQPMESKTQKELAFESNRDPEMETTSMPLHDEQEVHKQVTPASLMLESGGTLNSADHHLDQDIHGSPPKPLETIESGIQKELFEPTNDMKNELTSKHLHNEEVVHQITPETILESAGVSPAGHENHNLQQTMEISGETTQKQAVDENCLQEEVTSNHLQNEQEVVHYDPHVTPETILESASVNSVGHPNDHESSNLQQPTTMERRETETETSQKRASDEAKDQHIEKKITSKSDQLHEQEVVLKLTDYIC